MLESNTKAIVLASSVRKNIGPRYGSIGYVVSTERPTYMKNLSITNLPITNGISMSLTNVLFIRYGFEKERTGEYRSLLNLFPVITKPLRKGSTISKKMNKLLRNFNKSEFNEEPWFSVKATKTRNPNRLIVAILAPLKSTGEDLTSCSKVEFEAWLNSYVMNVRMRAALSKLCEEPYYSKLPLDNEYKELLHIFNEYSNSKTAKKVLIENIIYDDIARKAFIKTIVLAKSIAFGRINQASTIKALEMSSILGSSVNHLHTSRFMNYFTDKLFFGELPYQKRSKVINATLKNRIKPKEMVLNQLVETVDFLKSKASEIEKGPHGS